MKKTYQNQMKISFPSLSVNEGLARSAVAVFASQLNPTLEELADIKCAVSEAVTNAIVHGYSGGCGTVFLTVKYIDRTVRIEVRDKGRGIEDIALARSPLYTTDKTGERSGMGFAVMESFCDRVLVRSAVGAGTTIVLEKKLSPMLRV